MSVLARAQRVLEGVGSRARAHVNTWLECPPCVFTACSPGIQMPSPSRDNLPFGQLQNKSTKLYDTLVL